MITMTFEEAKSNLSTWINKKDGGLYSGGAYVSWHPKSDGDVIVLDGSFDPETLLAIAVYMMEYKP